MDALLEILPLLIPIVFIELAFSIAALIHILKHPNYRVGNRVMWIIIVMFVQLIGPIVYFIAGRGEEE